MMEMRQAVEDKEDAKSLKQKTRERVRPKMGKLTIDYQKLHDAFFKWQTKPKMSIHGDLYYEVSIDHDIPPPPPPPRLNLELFILLSYVNCVDVSLPGDTG